MGITNKIKITALSSDQVHDKHLHCGVEEEDDDADGVDWHDHPHGTTSLRCLRRRGGEEEKIGRAHV